MKIAVSDGSFGPRGMIAYVTWSNSNFGYPNLIDGTTGAAIDYLTLKNGETFRGTQPLGLKSYPSAVGIGAGRMLFGTAEEGLHVASQALPADVVINMNTYTAGLNQWQAKGYKLTHGPAGYGYYGLPLPWHDTPEIDYFLKANLHIETPPEPPPAPNVSASPSTAAFGNVTIGQTSAPKTIVVWNTGTAAATDMVYPAAPARFAKSGTCSGSTLNAGATCTIDFTYTPTTAVADVANYTITGGGATISIVLSGTGAPPPAPSLSASPTTLSFGSVTMGQSSSPRTVTITNSGTANAGGLAMTNGNALEFVVSNNTCGTSLATGAACTLDVTYTPSDTGMDSASLTFSYSGGAPAQVAMSGTGVAAPPPPPPPTPNVTASPSTAAFGNVTVGQVSAAKTIVISNTGTGDATGLAMTNDNFAEFVVSGSTCGTSLATGAACTLDVTYTPSDTGTDNASLTFSYSGGAPAQVAMSGTGVAAPPPPTPNVTASPSTAAFGNVTIGQTSAAKAIVVSNTGTAAATDMVYPAAPAKFTKSGSCTGSTLNAGATCTIDFTYTPTTAVTDVANYTITGGGATMSIVLSGTGVTPAAASLSASPTTLSFGSVTVGQSSSPRTVTITNGGTANASGLTMTNGNALEFVVSNSTCGTSLAMGASCTLDVTYTPSGAGADGANLTFSYSGGSPAQTVMSGTGLAPAAPKVTASPTSVAFGNVMVGQTSGPRAIIVSNTGSGDATNMTYPPAPANFNRSGTCSGATLSAGASCTVVFTYSPTTAKKVNATYTITGGGSTMPISMSGTGSTSPSASLSATPSSVSFGSVAPGTSSIQQSITVTNNGGATATGLSFSNTNASEFRVSNNTCGTKLGPGATCQLSVAYVPAASGFDNASLTWRYANDSLIVPVYGMAP